MLQSCPCIPECGIPNSTFITVSVLTITTRQMPHVKQDLHTHPVQLRLPHVYDVVRATQTLIL